jgi:hypothetical protein
LRNVKSGTGLNFGRRIRVIIHSNMNSNRADRPNSINDASPATETLSTDPSKPQEKATRITYGLMGWKGDREVVHRIALDDEFGVYESP